MSATDDEQQRDEDDERAARERRERREERRRRKERTRREGLRRRLGDSSAFKRETFYALENLNRANWPAKIVGGALFALILLNAVVVFVSAQPGLDCLAKITLSSNHLLALINEVLDLSMIENGRLVLTVGEVDLRALALEMETMFSQRCEESGIAFAIEFEGLAHPLVEGDGLRLQQVFMNMLGNAVKFTPAGGSVSLRVVEHASRVEGTSDYEFVFADTGCGMAPEFLAHVFEPFAREHDSRTESVEGTGLGLSVAQSVVSLMGGTIDVESEPGRGTVFTVRVSMRYVERNAKGVLGESDDADDARDASQGDAPAPRGADLSGVRVLLVEDNELNSEIAVALLESLGAAAETAANGQEALDALDASEPGYFDVVLMDIQMPVMNGLEATHRIRESARDDLRALPIVVLSANAFTEDVQESKRAGADDHLSKPISIKDLAATLGGILGRA